MNWRGFLIFMRVFLGGLLVTSHVGTKKRRGKERRGKVNGWIC